MKKLVILLLLVVFSCTKSSNTTTATNNSGNIPPITLYPYNPLPAPPIIYPPIKAEGCYYGIIIADTIVYQMYMTTDHKQVKVQIGTIWYLKTNCGLFDSLYLDYIFVDPKYNNKPRIDYSKWYIGDTVKFR